MTDRMRLATGADEVLAGLRSALAGGGPVAPLPTEPTEREQALVMLRPEVPVSEPAAAAVVATSGSTGAPRGAVLSRSALVASVRATHDRLGGPGSWVLALPSHYVAGLMVLARGVVADRALQVVDGRLSRLPELSLDPRERHYTSLVPTQLARAVADPELRRALARFTAVLVGGAAADRALVQRARSAGIAVVTTYGMTETCGGCVYDGMPLDGVDVTSTDGRLSIGGPVLFSGYRLDPTATAESLVHGRLRTRDRGHVVDGRVSVVGRVDDVVVSAGRNVDLAAVEQAVTSWAVVAGDEAAVVGVPHPEWGTEVVAVTAPGVRSSSSTDPTTDPTLAELRQALGGTLPGFALPRRLVRRGHLPRTSGGKIDRRRLVQELTDSGTIEEAGARR